MSAASGETCHSSLDSLPTARWPASTTTWTPHGRKESIIYDHIDEHDFPSASRVYARSSTVSTRDPAKAECGPTKGKSTVLSSHPLFLSKSSAFYAMSSMQGQTTKLRPLVLETQVCAHALFPQRRRGLAATLCTISCSSMRERLPLG